MAEVITTDTLLNNKLEQGWNRKDAVDNFKVDNELTVEITLDEYRRLIASDATKTVEIEKANKDKWERDTENSNLKKTVKELEMQLFEYRKKFGELDEVENG